MHSTDRGKVNAQDAQQAVRQADKVARAVLFERHDHLDFTSLGTLPKKAGVPVSDLRALVVKELVDNALDSCDRAGNPGEVEIRVNPTFATGPKFWEILRANS